jgi:hypothetical protein
MEHENECMSLLIQLVLKPSFHSKLAFSGVCFHIYLFLIRLEPARPLLPSLCSAVLFFSYWFFVLLAMRNMHMNRHYEDNPLYEVFFFCVYRAKVIMIFVISARRSPHVSKIISHTEMKNRSGYFSRIKKKYSLKYSYSNLFVSPPFLSNIRSP